MTQSKLAPLIVCCFEVKSEQNIEELNVMNHCRVTATFVDNAYWQVTIRASPVIAEFVRVVVAIIRIHCECQNVSCRCGQVVDCNCPCYSYEVITESDEEN